MHETVYHGNCTIDAILVISRIEVEEKEKQLVIRIGKGRERKDELNGDKNFLESISKKIEKKERRLYLK